MNLQEATQAAGDAEAAYKAATATADEAKAAYADAGEDDKPALLETANAAIHTSLEKFDEWSAVSRQRMELQQAFEAGAAAKENLHKNAGGLPDLAQQQQDMVDAMNAAAKGNDIKSYRSLRQQLKEHKVKHGNQLAEAHVSASESFSARQQRINDAAATRINVSSNASIEERMQAAANSGDMETYRRLRAERKSAA